MRELKPWEYDAERVAAWFKEEIGVPMIPETVKGSYYHYLGELYVVFSVKSSEIQCYSYAFSIDYAVNELGCKI